MNKYGVTTNPIFMPRRVEPRYSEFLTFIGISVDEGGENHYLDATIAYRRACLNAIALSAHGDLRHRHPADRRLADAERSRNLRADVLMPLYDFVCEGCGPFERWASGL
jgi:hypothetical protein